MAIFCKFRYVLVSFLVSTAANAGPAEDATGMLGRWKAAYDANDNSALGRLYTSEAVLHGTLSRDMTLGREAITKYFTIVVGSGNTVDFLEAKITVLNETSVIVVGYNNFNAMRDGKRLPIEARFTMVMNRQGNEWFVAHHHSSPRPAPPAPAIPKQ